MKEKLGVYNKKRNFEKTKEPVGKTKKAGKKRLFCIQYHCARKTHFDFRLEWDGVLLSWAVPKGPSYNPADKRLAIQVEDHPVDYGDFEGVIPKGEYGGGPVMLWDTGFWQPLNDVEEGLKDGSLKLEVFGKRIKGKWTFVRIKDKENKKNTWLLIKERDEFVLEDDGISDFQTSVKTGRTVDEILKDEDLTKKRNPFDKVDVQLATLVDKIPKGKNWLFELKYDGYRIVSFVEDGKAKLMTRNDHDFSSKFKQIVKALETFSAGRAFVLDGEIVVSDEQGRSNFQELQNYIKSPNDKNLSYIIFDLLALDGEDLRNLPILERKEKLKNLLSNAPSVLVFSEHVIGSGQECFEIADNMEMEGIVGKEISSVYSGMRTESWIKIKCYKRQEFVVGGYTLSDKKQSGISALLLGYYDKGKLVFTGKAGTGLTLREMEKLEQDFKKIKTEICPFSAAPDIKHDQVFWIKPKYVAEIQFAEWTKEGSLRQASFKGLRLDKAPKDVKKEIPKTEIEEKKALRKKSGSVFVCDVEISNPDKILFKDKGVTKLDMINYYEKVADRMLKIAGGRVLSVVRCHNGVNANCFYKKHPNTQSKGVKIIPIKNDENELSDYFYITDKRGLISEAQLGTIEFHIWGSKVETLEKPDMMVFDLDPDKGMDLKQIRQGVKDLKSVLDELNLKAFLKTSGGKGYHVVVPFKPTVSWDTFHDFSRKVAELMENKWSNKYTTNIRKDARKGKIFIDWVRNGRGATSVAPYSLRARAGACVSMPLKWSELDKVSPNGIDLKEALNRLKKVDPWKDFDKTEQELK